MGRERAEALYDRVLAEYGDDSVAQLGGAHIAVEGASNLLTKVLQWGRLASYLEQSTRYIPYTDRPGGSYRYHRPAAVMAHPELGPAYARTLDGAFDGYAALLPRMIGHVAAGLPADDATPEAARERAVRARALDLLRGLLPAATTANVGIFASGQAYEAMLVRMGAHPLPEARECAQRMLVELRKVIPAFLTRVDRVDRGVAHGEYLSAGDRAAAELAARLAPAGPAGARGAGRAPGRLRPRRRVARAGPRPLARERRARSATSAARSPPSAPPSATRPSRAGPGRGPTGASARAARSRRRPTPSRSSATTAPTATSSATAC